MPQTDLTKAIDDLAKLCNAQRETANEITIVKSRIVLKKKENKEAWRQAKSEKKSRKKEYKLDCKSEKLLVKEAKHEIKNKKNELRTLTQEIKTIVKNDKNLQHTLAKVALEEKKREEFLDKEVASRLNVQKKEQAFPSIIITEDHHELSQSGSSLHVAPKNTDKLDPIDLPSSDQPCTVPTPEFIEDDNAIPLKELDTKDSHEKESSADDGRLSGELEGLPSVAHSEVPLKVDNGAGSSDLQGSLQQITQVGGPFNEGGDDKDVSHLENDLSTQVPGTAETQLSRSLS